MAITVDQASLGSLAQDSAGSSEVLTTTNAVATGATIILVAAWFDSSAPAGNFEQRRGRRADLGD